MTLPTLNTPGMSMSRWLQSRCFHAHCDGLGAAPRWKLGSRRWGLGIDGCAHPAPEGMREGNARSFFVNQGKKSFQVGMISALTPTSRDTNTWRPMDDFAKVNCAVEWAKWKWALNSVQLKLRCRDATIENPREHKTLQPLHYKALNFFYVPLW